MKRKFSLLVAFLAAAITFGSLMAFVGPQNSGWSHHYYGWHSNWRHHYHHTHCDRHDHYEQKTFTDSATGY